MIKAIIFDLIEVCFEIDWLKINEEMIKRFNITTLVKSAGNEKAIQYYKEALEGKRPAREMFKELNKENHDLEEVVKYYKEIKRKNNGYCLTDTNSIHFEAHQEQGTTADFHKVFASFKLGHIKRDVNAFKKVIKDVNFKPEEIVFIDDNENNVEVAKSLGINGIKYEDYEKLIEQLKSLDII